MRRTPHCAKSSGRVSGNVMSSRSVSIIASTPPKGGASAGPACAAWITAAAPSCMSLVSMFMLSACALVASPVAALSSSALATVSVTCESHFPLSANSAPSGANPR
eukprot:5250243-Pyramimonas_sp.AAC.1